MSRAEHPDITESRRELGSIGRRRRATDARVVLPPPDAVRRGRRGPRRRLRRGRVEVRRRGDRSSLSSACGSIPSSTRCGSGSRRPISRSATSPWAGARVRHPRRFARAAPGHDHRAAPERGRERRHVHRRRCDRVPPRDGLRRRLIAGTAGRATVGCDDAMDRAPGGHRDPPVDAARRVPDPRHAASGTRPVTPGPDPVPAVVASVEMGRRAPQDDPGPRAGPGRGGALLLLPPAGRLGVLRAAGVRPDPVESRVRGRDRAGW